MKKFLLVTVAVTLSTCGPTLAPADTSKASWYHEGSRTANGERFRPHGLTVAHRSLAFGTRLRICHAGRCVVARVNDRGPAAWTGRTLDLSQGAAAVIGIISRGVATVTWNIIR